MPIITLGINHKTASLETREKVAFADKHKVELYTGLIGSSPVSQCVIVSTCNRTEIYALTAHVSDGHGALLKMLETVKGVNYSELENCLYFYSGIEAVAHLFRVTAGLDSMVLGETQILGQVREAYEKAVEQGVVGKELHGLFHNSVSVSYIAVEMIKKELGSFTGLRVLVIGAGKMSRLTLKHLHESGARDIWITSRTYQRAKNLAGSFNGRTIDFSRKKATLPAIDIIISSTGAPHLLLRKADMAAVMKQRNNKPVFIIDLAVPRDIEPAVRGLANVYLYDMDSLQQAAENNRRGREKDASAARSMVATEAENFQDWLNTLEVAPVIRALRQKAEQIRRFEVDRFLENKLSRLSEKEKLAVENLTRSVMNAILKEPILRIKDKALQQHEDEYVQSLLYLFDLKEEKIPEEKLVCKKGVN